MQLAYTRNTTLIALMSNELSKACAHDEIGPYPDSSFVILTS